MRLFKRDLSKLSDESLMGCVQDGDLAALDNLYSRYDSRLLHYFHRMLNRDEEKAQDFLQDLFVKIVERPSAFDTRQSFSTWIFTVAHNMCKNEYRRLEVRSRESMLAELQSDSGTPGAADLDFDIDARDFKEAVLEALEAFDPVQKTTFLLRYQENQSIREIGQTLNCSEGTVKSRLFYTTKRLARMLDALNPFTAECHPESE